MKKRQKQILTGSMAFVMTFTTAATMLPADVFAAPEEFRGQLSSVTDAKEDGNVVYVEFNDGAVEAKITFLEDGIFRYNVDPTGEFSKYAKPRSESHKGRIQQRPDESDEYSHPSAKVTEDDENVTITAGATSIVFDKDTALMTVKNGDQVVMQEKKPLRINDSSTVQTLVKQDSEDFFGGGTQNGRFVHTGESINIVNESGWTDGGVASPNPFYYTTGGYGVLRNTFADGWYDFGEDSADTVTTEHREAELDAYYFVSDTADKTSTVQNLLQDYYTVTGNPVLLPEYGFYLGHLNAYNRDSWDTSYYEETNAETETTYRAQAWTTKGTDSSDSEGTTVYENGRAAGYVLSGEYAAETLNGHGPSVAAENFPAGTETPYEYSARHVLDTYQEYDMPLGFFLPNDGYGAGYGQNGYYKTGGVDEDGSSSAERLAAVEANVENLAEFTEYANSKGVATGLWTQSYLVPDSNPNTYWHLLRDFAAEVKTGGVTTLKTDVAWVGNGYSMQLDGVKMAYETVTTSVGMRPNIISLDGWAGSQRYNSVWTGDQSGGQWEYIRFHIPTYIGQSLSGNPNIGSDMDGIHGGAPLIAARDYQWKSMTPQMLDMDGWGSYVKAPYTHGDPYTGISRMYLKLKAQMMPYTYTNAYAAANIDTGNGDTGLPMVRAMFLEFPEDDYAASKAMQYQYMYGPSLLVAPVYQDTEADAEGNDIRNNIYLPNDDGEETVWIDYFTGEQYQGGQAVNGYDAPLWKLPLFVKNGAIIPMYEENNNPETDLDKSNRIVEFWPAGSTEYTVIEDDGSTMTNKTTEDEEYGTIDHISYGGHVSTKLTSVVEDGTATLTAEASEGSYDGYDKNKNTEFIVNVSEEPESIVAKNGDQTLDIVTVESLADFEETVPGEDEVVYFYDASPEIKTYIPDESKEQKLQEMVADVEVAPKLHVKFAETDASANAQTLVINGFVNDGEFGKDELNENLTAPTPTAPEESKTPTSIRVTWEPVADAESYEVMVDGIINSVGSNTYFDHVDLAYNSEHTYQVRSRNAEGYSEWSTPELVTNSLDDPWRNVPDATVSWTGGDDWGALANATDHNTATMFHSTGNVVNDAVPFILDLGQGYRLDEFRYYPRGEGQGGDGNVGVNSNGTVQQMDVYISLDGQNWKQMHVGADDPWSYVEDTSIDDNVKTVELNGEFARYVKLVVTRSNGGFFAANELAVYKVDGSKGFAVGSIGINGNSEVTETDYNNMRNYLGIGSEAPAFATQVAQYGLDINYNNVYDVYDYAYTMFKLDGGTKKTGSVAGNALLLASAESLKAGDTLTIDVYADNVENLNAFGEVLYYDKGQLQFAGIEGGAGALNMENLSIGQEGYENPYVNLAFANRGDKDLYSGSGILATIKMTAKTDIENVADAIDLSSVMLIGPDYSVITTDAGNVPTIPEVPEGTTTEYGMSDFTITMTNDVLTTDEEGTNVTQIVQQGSYEPLFNGTNGREFEFKYDLGPDPLPDYVKLPTTMHFAFNEAKPLTNFTVYNSDQAGNGYLTSVSAVITFEDDTTKELSFAEEAAAYEFVVDSEKNVKNVDITFESATGNASYSDPSENRMLTLGEIDFLYTESVPVTGIAPAEDNVTELYVGYLADVNAVITPENAPNQFFMAESSDPSVASIITLADENGYPIYKVRGMSEGTATITLISAADESIKAEYTVNVKAGVDKSALQAVYDQYKNTPESLYTEESYQEFKTALDNAAAILVKADATRSEVETAAAALEQKYKALEVVPVDDSMALGSEIVANADGLYSESNTADKMFDGSLDTYWESPYGGSNANLPKDVIITLDDIYRLEQVSFTSHTIQNGGVTEYEVAVSMDGQTWTKVAAGSVDPEEYKQGQNVTVDARFLPVNAQYVKFTVLGAVGRIPAEDNVYGRVAEMVLFGTSQAAVDKEQAQAELQAKVDEMKAKLNLNYTEASWNAFQAKIAEAEAMLQNAGEYTAQNMRDMTTALDNVFAALEVNDQPGGTTPKENLQAAVDALKGLDEKRYTADSWAVFKNALDAAQAVLNKEGASDQEYTDALAALDAAYKGLVEKETPTDPSKPGSGNAGGSGSGSGGAVQTGDAASPAAVLAVLVISGGAVTVLARRRKMR